MLAALPCMAQQFEVASIKPSDAPDGSSSGITTTPGRISAHNVTLRRCVRGAWDLEDAQIFGGPKWFDEDRYNIDAKAAGSAGDHDLMIMLQALLAERFKLVVHREQRTFSGYALVVGKGLKAKPSEGNGSSINSTRKSIAAHGCTMAHLAEKLSEALHVAVVDQTGIPGGFDFMLEWSPEDMASGPSLFTALQEQLGLKLQASKVPVEVVVVDRAEKPTEN